MRVAFILAFGLFLTCLPSFANEPSNQGVGAYSLHTVKEANGDTVLYRINTITGEVWQYSERVALSSKSIAKDAEEEAKFEKVFDEAKKRGLNVYVQPYWEKTSEVASSEYLTMH